jgi:hypothetical protein
MTKRAAVYVRVSTDKQSESIENQDLPLRQIAERRGWNVVDVYEDEGIRLKALLTRAKCNLIRYSEAFPNANDLLAECARLGWEGIVAKRRDAPYRSGTRSGWIKVKTTEWRASNQWRAKFFEKAGRG